MLTLEPQNATLAQSPQQPKLLDDGTILRMESMTPSGYRLMRKLNGELVLQGVYSWQEGSHHGHEWRDIPTVIEEAK